MTEKVRFCAYCRRHKPDDGLFRFVYHAPSNSKRAQCGVCRETRRKPRAELHTMAQQEAALRRELASAEIKAALDRKRKGE